MQASVTQSADQSAAAGFEATLADWHGVLDRPAATPEALLANLRDLYQAIYATDFDRLQVSDVSHLAHAAIEDLFDLGLRLRDRLPEWRQQGLLTHEVATAARNAIRVLRYTCDIVGEVANGYERLAPGAAPHRGFEGPAHWTLMNPSLASSERPQLRSGDVVLVRGQLHNSAAIARVGDIDSQFSHVGIVHLDDDRQAWMVEALIEDGASLTPLDEALAHGLGRAMLFRHRDAALAARASRLIHDRVAASRQPFGRWIPYDFSMQVAGTDELFCSKLVRLAYAQASAGTIMLPTFHTRIDMKNRDFVERIGVTAVETFAPADLEVEPQFDLIAEWRDYRATSALRLQDLIMSKLFDWMDQHGYVFEEDAGIRAIEVFGGLSGVMPGFIKDGLSRWIPKVPSNMSTRTIGVIAMLHKTAQPLLERLQAFEAEHIQLTGRPLHPREAQLELEKIRRASNGRIGYLVIKPA